MTIRSKTRNGRSRRCRSTRRTWYCLGRRGLSSGRGGAGCRRLRGGFISLVEHTVKSRGGGERREYDFGRKRLRLIYATLIIGLMVGCRTCRGEKRSKARRRILVGRRRDYRRRRLILACTFGFARITLIDISSLAHPSLSLGQLLLGRNFFHVIFAEVLPEISTFETFKVLVPYGPLSAAYGPISRNFPKAYRGTENMPDAVHPSGFPTLEMGIHDGDPIIYLLQSQTVFWR